MPSQKPRVLLVSTDDLWADSCKAAFVAIDWEVHRFLNAFDGLEALTRVRFDIVLADNSCHDMGALEFVLNVRDMARNDPSIMIAGLGLARFRDVWEHCGVFHAEEKSGMVPRIPEYARKACPDRR